MISLENVRGIVDVFHAKTPSIGLLKKELGNDFIIHYLGLWITNLIEFLNLKDTMNPEQIKETCYWIQDTYKYLTIADIHLIFKRAKLGQQGILYSRIDGSVILSWFAKYLEERFDTAEEISLREHYDRTADEKVQRSGPSCDDSGYKDFIKKYQIEQLKKQANETAGK